MLAFPPYCLSFKCSISFHHSGFHQNRGGEEKMASLYMKLLLTRLSFRGRDDQRITSLSSSLEPNHQNEEKGRGRGGRSVLSRLLSWAKRSKERSKLALVVDESSTNTSSISGKEKKIGRGRSVNQFLFFGWCCTISGDGLKGNSSPLNLIEDTKKSISSSSSAARAQVDSGRYVKEVPLNLGIGFGLVYLVGACKNEFNKMTELRKEMEVLVKDVKNVISRKDDIGSSKLSEESNDNLHFFATNATEVGTATNHHHTAIQSYGFSNYHIAETEGVIQLEMYSESDSSSREDYDDGVDQLATELEVELERLQHRLDSEDSFEYQQHHEIEKVGENIAYVKTHNATFMDDSQEADNGDYYGVSPRELERRLHELLEEQQEERIRELESALEYTKEKLEEKELEVSWWKDAARLFSQHVSEETCMSSKVSIIQSRNFSSIERF